MYIQKENFITKLEEELLLDIPNHGSTLVQEGSVFAWTLLYSHPSYVIIAKEKHKENKHRQEG